MCITVCHCVITCLDVTSQHPYAGRTASVATGMNICWVHLGDIPFCAAVAFLVTYELSFQNGVKIVQIKSAVLGVREGGVR